VEVKVNPQELHQKKSWQQMIEDWKTVKSGRTPRLFLGKNLAFVLECYMCNNERGRESQGNVQCVQYDGK
jgi:hypothetical protein